MFTLMTVVGLLPEVAKENTTDIEMAAHYESGVEKDRLATWGRLEFIRTMEIVQRYLPQCAVVGDVGGGPGAYALPLAAAGHEVHLLDPMPLHIEQAEQASRAANGSGLASAQVGDARSLPWAAETFDAILLLGPLYHLTSAEDRRQSLAEARRVLRPGGFLAAAAISRFASTYDGLGREFLMEPEFQAIVERDVREGQHRNPSRREDWFTTSYFHRPDELASEVEGGGFVDPAVFAVEGPAGWLGNLDMWLDQAERRKVLLDAICRVEREPTLLGASLHLLAIAHRAPSDH